MNSLRLRCARQAARRVLAETALERAKPVPVEQIANALGVQIVDGELDGALAALTRVGDRARICVSTRNIYPGQRRFTIAHELGHYVLGHSTAHVCTDPNAAAACDSLQEREADVFASELLMPELSMGIRKRAYPVKSTAPAQIPSPAARPKSCPRATQWGRSGAPKPAKARG